MIINTIEAVQIPENMTKFIMQSKDFKKYLAGNELFVI